MSKQLDWDKAKEICEKHKGCVITAGLGEDMFFTGGVIFDGQHRVKEHAPFVASTWATPVVIVHTPEGHLCIPCYVNGNDPFMPDWWPEIILDEEDED